ncbi:hypothetical protein [Streptomyces sp. S.PNR 29]|uniref:hypothetical protein n=1 Tax=Streptomyces sp. S.PNR 29 TaxID=2973805 RepID=UPI0025B0724E|nr:hypothetical protein [Streptomyces sp. S.PNR 29]MDN0195380.1 hypothetical protein [Streptomyces sp. S.PNR 29]
MTTTDTWAQPQREAGSHVDGTGAGRFRPRVRGRHRKPRTRRALLAAGGLVLAAGALSLVRLVPDTDVHDVGATEAEPRPDLDTGGADPATGTAATLAAAVPAVSPSSTSALGDLTAAPDRTPAASRSAPTAPRTPPAAKSTDAPNAPAPATTAPRPPRPTHGAPRPEPTPASSRTTPAVPAPKPDKSALCVPVIGLCVDPPAERG